MKKENIERAYILKIKIQRLKEFLKVKKKCWGILDITKTERKYFLKSSYGIYNETIEADSELSELITNAIEKRIEMYLNELRDIGIEVEK